MASEFEIQIRNTKVKIIVGRGSGQSSGGDGPGEASSDTASGAYKAGDGPGEASSETASGTPASRGGCCCEPVVIGPIVISGASMQAGPGVQGGDGPGEASSDTASGAPGSGGSCCCAPVVVGPIVFTGCTSDQSTATASTVQQICVPPPSIAAQGTAPSFVMQQQQQTNWCWAATAISVHAFLDPLPGTLANVLAQPTLATELLHKQNPAASPNCGIAKDAKSTKLCNQAERLDTALTITGNLRAAGFLKNCCLSFACLQGWLSMKFPVCARIVWRGGGAHFIALDACWVSPTGAQKVHVQDPNGAPSVQDYQTLVDDLYGSGYWHDTYLTTK